MAQSGPSFEEFASHLLAILEQAIGFDTGTLVHGNMGPGLTTRNMDAEQLQYLRKSQEHAHSRYARDFERPFAISLQQGGCIDREIYPWSQIKKLLVYREVLEPAGVRSMLHLCGSWQGQPIFRVNLNRHGRHLFRPSHLERALCLLPTVEASVVSLRVSAQTLGLQSLSPRELEVARHAARGLTTPQIASILGTSKFTVRNQLVSVFDKLKVASRSELAAFMAARDALSGPQPFQP